MKGDHVAAAMRRTDLFYGSEIAAIATGDYARLGEHIARVELALSEPPRIGVACAPVDRRYGGPGPRAYAERELRLARYTEIINECLSSLRAALR